MSPSLPLVVHQPATNPILPVDDMAVAIDFYRRLGFGVTAYDDHYAWVQHSGWEWLHLRLVDSVEGNQASAYLHVSNADAWRAAMTEASGGGIDIGPLADMPWGLREYSFTDPSGNIVRLGHNL